MLCIIREKILREKKLTNLGKAISISMLIF